jgi:uncharacterized protein YbaR (Trm112 family)
MGRRTSCSSPEPSRSWAALTPRPEINLLLYHGVLAPHARWRQQVVGYGRAASEAAAVDPAEPAGSPPPRNWTWAALMRRAFALDVLACPRCGGRLRVIATVEDPVAVRHILAARRPAEPLGPGPPAPAGAPRHGTELHLTSPD